MKKILFVCMGNTCRSPMAMFIYKKLFPETDVFSAGFCTVPGLTMSDNSKNVLLKKGFDENEINNFKTSSLQDYNLEDFDTIYALSPYIGEQINNEKVIVINIPDPFGQDFSVYEKVFSEMETKIKQL